MPFDDDYADVPAAQRDELQQFRAAHPPQQTQAIGHTWTYLEAGAQGEAPLLWLVGGLRVADAAYKSLPLLADAHRIIAPDYAPVDTMAAMADGLVAVLDAAGVEQAHVLSGSFGGMIAQVLVRRHPQRVGRLVLSTTAAPSPDLAARYQQQLDVLSVADEAIVREGAQHTFMGLIQPPAELKAFYRAYLKELFTQRLGKADLLSTYRCIIDYMTHYRFAPDDLADWAGAVLLLDSDNDETFRLDMGDRLQALYPNAQRHTFVGAGHSPGSTQRDAYFALVRQFLTTGRIH